MMVHLDYAVMTEEERDFVDNLIRVIIFDIVKLGDVPFIEDVMFEKFDDIEKVRYSVIKNLSHRRNHACLVKTPDSSLRC